MLLLFLFTAILISNVIIVLLLLWTVLLFCLILLSLFVVVIIAVIIFIFTVIFSTKAGITSVINYAYSTEEKQVSFIGSFPYQDLYVLWFSEWWEIHAQTGRGSKRNVM